MPLTTRGLLDHHILFYISTCFTEYVLPPAFVLCHQCASQSVRVCTSLLVILGVSSDGHQNEGEELTNEKDPFKWRHTHTRTYSLTRTHAHRAAHALTRRLVR